MAIAVTTERALPGIPFPGSRSADSNRNAAIVLSAGLQWQVPIPLSAIDHYAKGPNGKDQPYQLLIPGLWLGAAKNKHQLIALIMPFTGTPLSNKYYEKGVARTSDSLMAYKSMVKIFGLQAGIHYYYQADRHWCIGAGLDANWWNKGLVYAKPVDDSLGMGIKPFLYSVNPQTEKKLNPFQLSTVIEAGYRIKAWDGILQLSRPWNATLKGQSPPVWLRLVIRYRLLRKQSGQIR